MKKKILMFFVLFFYFSIQTPANGIENLETFDTLQERIQKVIKNSKYKVATIKTISKRGNRKFGSGFLVSKNGEIITNEHVIYRANKIKVIFGRQEYEAKVIKKCEELDLALLKIEIPPNMKIPFLEFDDSDRIKEGEFVIAIGSPFGLKGTNTLGIISNPKQTIPEDSWRENTRDIKSAVFYFIQTDASINPGNSGGPLISLKTGKVVGLSSAILGQGSVGLNFAIPANIVKNFIENDSIIKALATSRKINKSKNWLKILFQELNKDIKRLFKIPEELDGLLISSVGKDSPAYSKVKQGDLILEVNGKKITQTAEFEQIVVLTTKGGKLKLKIFQKSAKKTIEIIITN